MPTNLTCLVCHTRLSVAENVTASTLVCPRCLAEVDYEDYQKPVRLGEVPHLFRDIRRDGHLVRWILWLLIGLCAAGIGLCFLTGVSAQGKEAESSLVTMMIGFAALDLLIILATSVPLWRYVLQGSRSVSLGGIVIRVLGLVVLTLALGMAIVVFFFVVCFGMALPLIKGPFH